MSYKGFYKTIKEAANANKYISYIPSKDGKIYEVRNAEIGIISTPATKVNIEEINEINSFFKFRLPKIPYDILLQIIAFFKHFNGINGGKEALVQLYWDKIDEIYHIEVPKQKVNKVKVTTDEETLDDNRYLLVADIHSHNNMRAKFSAQDDYDDKATRIYVVIGKLDNAFPEVSIRVSNGGKYLTLSMEEIFEIPSYFPQEWIEKVGIIEMSDEESKEVMEEEIAAIYEEVYCFEK